jgi:hypothetical protein
MDGHVTLEPTDENDRFAAVLAPGQVCGRSCLVGHRYPRGAQLTSDGIPLSAPIL